MKAIARITATCCILCTTAGFSENNFLKGEYEFETGSGTVAIDSSTNENHANLVNGVKWSSDGEYNCVNFCPANQSYLELGSTNSLAGKTDFTVSAWVKITPDSNGVIIQQRSKPISGVTTGYNGEYQLAVKSNKLSFFLYGDGKYQFNLVSSTVIADDIWHFVTAGRCGEEGFLYIDGVLEAQEFSICRNLDSNIPVYVGGDLRDNKNFLDGLLDDLKIYSTALTDNEISFLAQNRGVRLFDDSDNDGISNADEINIGIDPFSAESDLDSDGVPGAVELANGTDPNVHNGATAPLGWMFAKIGNATTDSSISYNKRSKTYNFNISAGDIWNKNDNFGYAYKTVEGNFSATVKVDSLKCAHHWSKACLMVRSSLAENAAYGSVLVSKSRGVALQYRKATNNNAIHKGKTGIATPYWLRIIRKGSTVSGYISHNGSYWAKLHSTEIELNDCVKVGLAVTSNSLNHIANVEFSNITINSLNDIDLDGLADIEEEMLASSEANPNTDMDQSDDLPELDAGTSLVVSPTEINGKSYHKNGLIAKFHFGYFSKLPDFQSLPVNEVLLHKSASFDLGWDDISSKTGRNITAMTLNSMIYIPKSGNYTFYTNSDDGTALLIDDVIIVNNDGNHGMQERTGSVELTAGLHKFELQYYQAGGAAGLWTSWSGPELPKQIIKPSYLVYADEDFSHALTLKDRDSDGLTDAFEDEIGSDKTKSDSDGDGLADAEEHAIGSDLNNSDSDGDGIGDYAEVKEYYTNPLDKEFDGTVETLVSLSGADAEVLRGSWTKTENSIWSNKVRGDVNFPVSLAEAGAFRLQIAANDHLNKDRISRIDIFVDEQFITSKDVTFGAEDDTVSALMPYLTAGTHNIRIFWENANPRYNLEIKELQVQKLGGPDSNENNTPDWLDTCLGKRCTVNPVNSSKTSPVCLEGNAKFLSMMQIAGATVKNGAGDKWYADVVLNASAPKSVQVSFQNGVKVVNSTINWEATDILTNDTIIIRQGDSLKLVASGEAVEGETNVHSFIDNIEVTAPVVRQFNEAGEFVVHGSRISDQNSVNSTLTVKVIAKSAALEFACREDKQRTINLELPEGIVLEADSRLKQFEQGATAPQYSVTIDTNRERYLIARIGENGPVIGAHKLTGFRFYGCGQTELYGNIIEDGSLDASLTMITSPALTQVSYKINMWLVGVFFEDGSTTSTLTDTDFDELGIKALHFIKTPEAKKTSICHHAEIYENGEFQEKVY